MKSVVMYNMTKKQLPKKRVIPIEIDDHFRLFGKEPWEVEYLEKCPLCKSRIDEYGFCSCGSRGDQNFLQTQFDSRTGKQYCKIRVTQNSSVKVINDETNYTV